ncbi:MAG TPA: hypothetical protein PLW24_20690 [Burkholderiaceae bacterium]|nr:hypothetical protein [Burkholderiaceae bacterium]HNB46239.1 hypothetical protein [Burkholderiaceae bacterium]HNG81900.1 hypothetical protein [Burkholderiaceae bacterium]
MVRRFAFVALIVLAAGLSGAPVLAQSLDLSVAGLQPDRRPEAAPRQVAPTADAALKQRRLQGVEQPWPGNVERIAEQGAWFSPMFAPGMTGRYDLRGWHRHSGAAQP